MARFLSSTKPAALLRQYIPAAKESTCYGWAAGRAEPPAGVMVTLLRGDLGWRVLCWIMDGIAAPWWLELQRAKRIADQIDKLDLT